MFDEPAEVFSLTFCPSHYPCLPTLPFLVSLPWSGISRGLFKKSECLWETAEKCNEFKIILSCMIGFCNFFMSVPRKYEKLLIAFFNIFKGLYVFFPSAVNWTGFFFSFRECRDIFNTYELNTYVQYFLIMQLSSVSSSFSA